jgi:hypothetical protein
MNLKYQCLVLLKFRRTACMREQIITKSCWKTV